MLIVDYYARPASAKHGGVNTSRNELITALITHTDSQVVMIEHLNGYHATPIPNVRILGIKHLFSHHALMLPIGITRHLRSADLLILHEGWNLGNLYCAVLARKLKKKYVVIPHGVYDPMVVQNMKIKKLRKYFEKWVISHSIFVNVFFKDEAHHISLISQSAQIVVAPTGLSPYLHRYAWTGGGDYAYFAGRLDVNHKGLDILLDSWAVADLKMKLILQGPDFFGGEKFLREKIEKLNLEEFVTILPSGPHSEVMELLEKCVFFVHISRWESYGRSVVDAMAIGTPILISNCMNIARVNGISDHALVTPLEVKPIVACLRRLQNTSIGEDSVIARRSWTEEKFAWKETVRIFFSALEADPRPVA
jgi:glycosyltransferase involved in cell wall biosynthesis